MKNSGNYFEVLYYVGKTAALAVQKDFITKKFESKKDALNFFEKHNNDNDKHAFWVTERKLNGDLYNEIFYQFI